MGDFQYKDKKCKNKDNIPCHGNFGLGGKNKRRD